LPNGQLAFSSYLGGKFDEYGNDVVLSTDGGLPGHGKRPPRRFAVHACSSKRSRDRYQHMLVFERIPSIHE
jgi:hypothetical protein